MWGVEGEYKPFKEAGNKSTIIYENPSIIRIEIKKKKKNDLYKYRSPIKPWLHESTI